MRNTIISVLSVSALAAASPVANWGGAQTSSAAAPWGGAPSSSAPAPAAPALVCSESNGNCDGDSTNSGSGNTQGLGALNDNLNGALSGNADGNDVPVNAIVPVSVLSGKRRRNAPACTESNGNCDGDSANVGSGNTQGLGALNDNLNGAVSGNADGNDIPVNAIVPISVLSGKRRRNAPACSESNGNCDGDSANVGSGNTQGLGALNDNLNGALSGNVDGNDIPVNAIVPVDVLSAIKRRNAPACSESNGNCDGDSANVGSGNTQGLGLLNDNLNGALSGNLDGNDIPVNVVVPIDVLSGEGEEA